MDTGTVSVIRSCDDVSMRRLEQCLVLVRVLDLQVSLGLESLEGNLLGTRSTLPTILGT